MAEIFVVFQNVKRSDFPVTSRELAKHMGIDRYITARRLPELRDAGIVENCEERVCTVGKRLCVTWRVL